MKGATNISRMQVLVNEFLDTLIPPEKPAPNPTPEKKLPLDECQRQERKDFSYYMQLINYDSQELVGHLADISTGGFKMDSQKPIPPNKDYRFRLDLTSEVADKPSMVFVARSRWCQVDPLDPFCYNVGFQLIDIAPGDLEIFNRIIERYGTKKEELRSIDLRRSNKW
jgi:hypothetical protein